MKKDWKDRVITREEITLYEWLESWLTHPTQRDHVKRSKTTSFKKKMKVRIPEHLEMKGVKCGCNFENPVTGQKYKKSDQIKTDGHTRAQHYSELPEEQRPAKLYVSWLYVYSYEELVDVYTWYDSATSAEKANDRVDGAVRCVLHPKGKYLTDDRLRKVTPIEYASALCYPAEFKRGEVSTHQTIVTQINYFQNALLWLQSVISDVNFGKSVALTAPLICSYLASYQKYKNDPNSLEKLKNFIVDVSNNASNFRQKPMDCVSMFLREWNDENSPRRGRGVLNMKPQSEQMQGFILLMIDKWIQGESYQKCPDTWKTYYSKWQTDYTNSAVITILEEAFNLA